MIGAHKPELSNGEEATPEPRVRRKLIYKPISELQENKQMSRVRDLQGNTTKEPEKIAQVFKQFLGGLMTDKGIVESECGKYIHAIPIRRRIAFGEHSPYACNTHTR